MTPPVGLVGLGAMGRPIAQALAASGAKLRVHDVAEPARDWARSVGLDVAETLADCVTECEVLILSLPTPDVIRAVVSSLGDWSGLVLDTSTNDPTTARHLSAQRDGRFADTPILGRPGFVGRWTVPVGGSAEAAAVAAEVLAPVAAKVIHVGGPGSASTIKVVNNMMLGVINAVTAEALALAEACGADPGAFVDVIIDSGAASVSGLFRDVAPRAIDGAFEPAFSLRLMHKDTRLALDLAAEHGLPLFVTPAAQQLNTMGLALGHGDEDSIAVIKVLEEFVGRPVRRHGR